MLARGAPLALQARGLGARVGSRWILRDVTFEARRGEIVAVIGPNGAGKTTLLELVAGLRPASAGTIQVNDEPLRRFVQFARAFSFLPDAGRLPPEATVSTLIEHAAAQAPPDVETRTLMSDLSIAPLLSQPVGVLSRGEHQRVALFCTLAIGRPIAVLDEPFAAFDPLQLRKVLATVRNATASKRAVVASIHQLADAERIADRILILAEGRMVAFSDLASLRQRVGNAEASLEDIFVSLLDEANRAS